MRFDILTLFPDMFTGPLTESMLKRAQQAGIIEIALHNIRDFAPDRHRTTDDAPYGGGAGMVMKVVPLAACIRHVLAHHTTPPPVILLSPAGKYSPKRMRSSLPSCLRWCWCAGTTKV